VNICDDYDNISLSFFVRIVNVTDKSCIENQTHILFSITCSLKITSFMGRCGKKYCTAGQETYENLARAYSTLQAHSKYGILITFPLQQQGLHKRDSTLRYTYSACLLQHYLVKGTIVGGRNYWTKIHVSIFSTNYVLATFLVLRITQRDTVINLMCGWPCIIIQCG